MQSLRLSAVASWLLSTLAIPVLPAFAATDSTCTFNSQLDAQNYSFNIMATSEDTCKSQLLRISVHRDGNPFTQFITPSRVIVEKAWIVDVDDDGRHELLVTSHDPQDYSKKSMELYAIDGAVLKQVRFPEPSDMTGYRGGDVYSREGSRIVRAFPVYQPRDVIGAPTGGERRVVYQYRNRQLLLGSETAVPGKAGAVQKESKPAKGKKSASLLKINGIKPKADYIEIQASGSIENYKVVRIADPWRLIIDIPGASSGFDEKMVVINSLGVSIARIGEHKGYLRIVFDSTVSPLPTETVTPAENALRIGFYNQLAK